ncbi:Glycosyltransferase (fragment) [Rhodospirillaceae bacterium LM-1]
MSQFRTITSSIARHVLSTGYSRARRLGLFDPGATPILYLAEKADWSIRHDGLSYCKALEATHPGTTRFSVRPEHATGRIAHFGSQFVWQAWNKTLDPNARRLVTFFHGKPEDGPQMKEHVTYLLDHLGDLEFVVTASSLVERRLLSWGVPEKKVARVPLGVDLRLFSPPDAHEREAARNFFGVPTESICIGSFQKDGSGWGEGMEPKLIKGPDLFVDTVAILARHFPVFVLLTGPARGYVKRRLAGLGIPFSHRMLQRAELVSQAFKAIDLYIVASREEGGPKAILESLACGVPLVTTAVGMAEDVVRDGVSGCLVQTPDANALAQRAGELLASPELASKLAAQGLADVRPFAWDKVAELLFERVYKKLLARST